MTQLDELRHLIVGDSSEQLAELKDRIENVEKRTDDVAEVLSPAIAKEAASADSALVDSLQKPVSIGLKRAIRSEPKEYAEILYPVMAPAIRRAIAQSISSMMVTINRTIESATTVQGMRLRYQAMITGIPYGELALRQTLLYRVEHLYLIHRETGMAIVNVHADDTESLDSDAVSAMFSAIQSFVQDSFSRDETSQLTDLKVGDQNVWVAHGPHAMLACVIRGDAPESLKNELYDTLDLIRTSHANALVDFDGDQTPFSEVGTILGPLLQSELKDSSDVDEVKVKKSKPITSVLTSLVLIAAILYFFVQWYNDRSQVETIKHFLVDAPGVSTTNIYWEDDILIIEGFKDPDAVIPYDTFDSYGINPEKIQFKTIPFRSLEASMELQRFNDQFELPNGVTIELIDGNIQLAGSAPLRWLETNRDRILQLAADRRLSISGLIASHQSVMSRLRAQLPDANLDGIGTSSIAVIVNNYSYMKVQISGISDVSDLNKLKALLINNDWVSVSPE